MIGPGKDETMDLYFVAVILVPTEKEKYDTGAIPTIVVQPQAVIAKDEQQAAMKAMRLVPQEYADKEARLEVRAVPFGKLAR